MSPTRKVRKRGPKRVVRHPKAAPRHRAPPPSHRTGWEREQEAPRKRRNPPYTKELGEEICQRIANGASGVSVCRDPDMPDWPTIARWVRQRKDFAVMYREARELQAEYWADELTDISDDGRNDYVDRLNNKGEVIGQALDREHFERSRLRVQTRQFIVSRRLRAVYGDKTSHELSTPGGPLGVAVEERSALIDAIVSLVSPKADGKTRPDKPESERRG